ncbi:PTS sugar transporter subunit IIA [Polycladomyces subterraneus]|uniref:Fructose PTS transporter subunit IIA n=1 Tax=Polycladomyces subterraneus TaxID=1016997 RepID=A0ABT8IMN0_9BACL|nr:fructose PTS transporter subunit IIA [Polycladomyces subterraneus]MDN4594030.1 fructose PTS transporter subunit IIA [Polycladomyces subterraneus]
MDLKTVIKPDSMMLSLEASTREEVIQQLSDRLKQQGVITDVEGYLQDVEEREKMGSTAIGFDVAIPHAKSASVTQPAVAFARLSESIYWNADQADTVRLVFLIAVPQEQAGNEHLQILAALSRKLMHAEVRDRLMQAETKEQILDALAS